MVTSTAALMVTSTAALMATSTAALMVTSTAALMVTSTAALMVTSRTQVRRPGTCLRHAPHGNDFAQRSDDVLHVCQFNLEVLCQRVGAFPDG